MGCARTSHQAADAGGRTLHVGSASFVGHQSRANLLSLGVVPSISDPKAPPLPLCVAANARVSNTQLSCKMRCEPVRVPNPTVDDHQRIRYIAAPIERSR
jgi:hypothetical protein